MAIPATDRVIIEGEIALWIEQGAVHLKLLTNYKDPVELTTSNARKLATKLLELAIEIDKEG